MRLLCTPAAFAVDAAACKAVQTTTLHAPQPAPLHCHLACLPAGLSGLPSCSTRTLAGGWSFTPPPQPSLSILAMGALCDGAECRLGGIVSGVLACFAACLAVAAALSFCTQHHQPLQRGLADYTSPPAESYHPGWTRPARAVHSTQRMMAWPLRWAQGSALRRAVLLGAGIWLP